MKKTMRTGWTILLLAVVTLVSACQMGRGADRSGDWRNGSQSAPPNPGSD